jgi:AraC-like DNA-binding protein
MSRQSSDFVGRIVRELERKKGSLTAVEAAKLVNRSESHMRHVFRRSAGMPFRRARLRARLELARDLLVHTRMTIPTISKRLRYSDRSKFERAFKKVFGLTPAQYRRRP